MTGMDGPRPADFMDRVIAAMRHPEVAAVGARFDETDPTGNTVRFEATDAAGEVVLTWLVDEDGQPIEEEQT